MVQQIPDKHIDYLIKKTIKFTMNIWKPSDKDADLFFNSRGR